MHDGHGEYISLKTPLLGAHKVGQSGEYDFELLIGYGTFSVDQLLFPITVQKSKIKIIHQSPR
jgi:hypothetical protein